MVLLKKTDYVESHELGVADTVLQIGITWCLSLFVFYAVKYLIKAKYVKEIVNAFGNISYELYLAHVLPLDWLNEQGTVNGLLEYGLVVAIITIILYLINSLIRLTENDIVRN